jgi:hypothetical protein
VPCDNDVDQTTDVVSGRLELTPAEGIPVAGGRRFTLTAATIRFAPFSVSRSCLGFGETRNYTEVGVQLAQVMSFTASPAGGTLYNVLIPKDNFVFRENALVNGEVETGNRRACEDVAGTIDIGTGAVQMHAVVTTSVHFQAGCLPLVGCIIDETKSGRLTADLAGTMTFPDSDGDTVPDRVDNCRFVFNPDQSPVATPAITVPPNVTLGSCADRAIGFASASDRCDAGPVSVTSDAPGTFASGANVVTWTARDQQGRTASRTQTVTVADTTAPTFTFVPPDVEARNCGPVALGRPTATDDCAGAPTFSNNAPFFFRAGTTAVTWTATDAARNRSTATQRVTVTDAVAPLASCRELRFKDDLFQVSSIDACTRTPTITLGQYTLANGEIIKIEESHHPGVKLLKVVHGIKHFRVGRGEAVIRAVDQAGNQTTAPCRDDDDPGHHDHGRR